MRVESRVVFWAVVAHGLVTLAITHLFNHPTFEFIAAAGSVGAAVMGCRQLTCVEGSHNTPWMLVSLLLGALAGLIATVSIYFETNWPPRVDAAAGAAVTAAIVALAFFAPGKGDINDRLLRIAIGLPPAWAIPLFFRRLARLGDWYEIPVTPLVPVMAVVAALAASYFVDPDPGRRTPARIRFPILMLVWSGLAGWIIVRLPVPDIDVLMVQQAASAELLRAENPYAAVHPDIKWKPGIDGESIRAGDGTKSFPYPPLSLILVIPGWLAGDVRWSLLAAQLGATVAVVAAGRRLGLAAGHPAELVAATILFDPWGPLMVYRSFTEPLLALTAGLTLWAVAAGLGRTAGLFLLASVTVKQFGIFWALPILAAGRIPVRALILGTIVAAAIILPFLIADPGAFRLGVYITLASGPPRSESLSLTAALSRATGRPISPFVGVAIAAAVAAPILFQVRRVPSLALATLGSAAIFLTLIVTGKAANTKYFWFASFLLLASIVLACGEASADHSADPEEPVPPPLQSPA